MPAASIPAPQAAPQNPFATPGSDPNADLLKSSLAQDPTQIATPNGGSYAAVQPTSPVVTSSSPAATYVNNLGTNIANGQNNPPSTPSTSNPTGDPATQPPAQYLQYDGTYGPNPDPYGFGTQGYNPATDPRVTSDSTSANSIYTNRQTQLDQQRANEIASLRQQETNDQASLAQTQKAETATSSRNLSYLQEGGTSASAQAYLVSLEQSHQQEMQNLVAKYQSAIQTAQSAYDDKDFALAEAMTKNASDIKAAAAKRNQDFLDYTLKIRQQANEDAKTAYALQADVRTANATNLKFARDNGLHPGAQFFSSGGQVYNAADGSQVGSTKDELLAAGVSPDLSNVQMIEQTKARPGVLGELDDFNKGLTAEGKPPINIEQWLQMKKQDAVDIAKAGRASVTISAAQQQFNLTQEETQHLAAVSQAWKDNKYIQGNGTISSGDYRKAKSAFVEKFGAAAGPAFDSAMAVYVDASDTNHYQAQYGLNKQVAGNSLGQ